MFKCVLGIEGRRFRVAIDGCPRSGLAAIDFRRRHGLPDEPSNVQELPGYVWADEEFVRENAELSDGEADINCQGKAGDQENWQTTAAGKVCLNSHYCRSITGEGGYYVKVSPEVVRAYLAEQTPETARAVFRDIWDGSVRNKLRAVAEVYILADPDERRAALEKELGGDQELLARACALADQEAEGKGR